VTRNVYGCTFTGPIVDDYNPGVIFEENYSGGGFNICDCRFMGPDSLSGILIILYDNYDTDAIFTFNNCYFSPNSTLRYNYVDVPLDSSVTGLYANVIFTDCHFDYDFGNVTPPTALSATLSTKNAFGRSTFNVPVETDPTILQRWSDNGYTAGLFG
jgi:hypothetical protein